MGDVQLSLNFNNKLNQLREEEFSDMFFGHHEENCCLFKHSRTIFLRVSSNSQTPTFSKIVNEKIEGKCKIVGIDNCILLLDSEGTLYKWIHKFQEITQNISYEWFPFEIPSFQKVLAITSRISDFTCLGLDKRGNIKLKNFSYDSLRTDSKEEILTDLKVTQPHNYFLCDLNSPEEQSTIISDGFSGRTFLYTPKRMSEIYRSNIKLIAAIPFLLEKQFLLCFENGKLVFYSCPEPFRDSAPSQNNVLYLGERIVCIEKCPCRPACLFWSNGVNLHHTKIDFFEDGVKMTHFKVKPNVVGVLQLKYGIDRFFAYTINKIYYEIKLPEANAGVELVQNPPDILQQIYKESSKLHVFQKNLEMYSYYAVCKEMIQNNRVEIEFVLKGNSFIIKNMTRLTFMKDFWKIKLSMFEQGCERVKLVDLETDLVNEMMISIENPFAKCGNVKVYLFGVFRREILCFCVGKVEKTCHQSKESLKKKLDLIRLQKNSSFDEN